MVLSADSPFLEFLKFNSRARLDASVEIVAPLELRACRQYDTLLRVLLKCSNNRVHRLEQHKGFKTKPSSLASKTSVGITGINYLAS